MIPFVCKLISRNLLQTYTKTKWILFLAISTLGVLHAKAQDRFPLSGYITDDKTGESMIGAAVIIQELPGTGTITNTYGFYSITLPSGNYHIIVQSIGYQSDEKSINLDRPLKLDFSLLEESKKLEEVIVTSQASDENIVQTQTGTQKLSMNEIKSIPVLFGERDVLKTIQLLPGVKSTGEGSSGFNVRGGASDQNLILLDESVVYNASHLMGFFSVFNSDAVKDMTIFKGNEPAEYGGRLSSVLDITTKDGNNKEYEANGGLGLISSHLTLEGPLVKDKSSFIVSARRTYLDMFLKLSSDDDLNSTKLYFYDINAKTNYKINDKNRIFLSGYFGKDAMGMNSFGMKWGNSTGTFRWNHLFSNRLFSNTSLIFSNYNYKIKIETDEEVNIISRIQDYGIKQDYQFFMGSNNSIKFGFSSTYHKIVPGAITSTGDINLEDLTNKYSLESAAYLSVEQKFSNKLSADYGLRYSSFSALGPGSFYTYDDEGNAIDTASYSSGEIVKTYNNFEPRATLNYTINRESSIKAAYARNVQNLHLLSNSTSGNPTDLWIPSSNNVKPEIADQFSLGYYRNFKENLYEFSIEMYYKDMQNQIDYKNGAELNYNENVESQILFGVGRAYGTELFFKKKRGQFNGWISYTLSRTERKFDDINNGNYYPAKQDRTHDISVVAMYEASKKWSLSATWVYNTGNAVTYPRGKYEIDGKTMMLYSDRNTERMPAYHRLDLGATMVGKKTDRFESSWSFSVYNFYSRDNAYTITFRDSETDSDRTEVVLMSLFKFIPSVTYNFKF